MERTEQKGFSDWVVGIIWLNIVFGGIRGVMNSIANMMLSPLIGCLTLSLTIIGLVSLCYILQAKRWALFLWIAYCLSSGIINGYLSMNHDYVTYILIAIITIALMILVLQIKKDGISAWSIIFKKQKNDNKDACFFAYAETNSEEVFQPKDKGDKEIIEKTNFEEEYYTPQEGTNNELVDNVSSVPSIELDQKEKPQTFDNDISCKNGNNTPGPKKRNWWLYLLIVFSVLAICGLTFWIFHRPSELKIGEYVYVDKFSILHTNHNCDKIAVFRGAKPISSYSLNEILRDNWKYICSKCVDDIIYEEIESQVVINENLKIVYDILRKEDYTPPVFNQFVKDMEDEENLRRIFSTLQKEGYITPSFDDFMIDMGHDPEQPATQEVSYEKNNKRLLYDDMIDEYDLGTFEQFSIDVENEDKRKKLFNEIKHKYRISDFDFFTRYLLDNEKTN